MRASEVKATEIVPLFIFMSQKEVLHLLPAEVNLVLIVAFYCLSFIHRVIQGQQELLKALHYGRGWTQIHVMDVAKPNVKEMSFGHSCETSSIFCIKVSGIVEKLKFNY